MEHAHKEKRGFPRIPVDCPILFRCPDSDKWLLASIQDFSAVGFSMSCDTELLLEGKIKFELRQSGNRMIPNLRGTARIVRVRETNQGGYSVSCKILNIKPFE